MADTAYEAYRDAEIGLLGSILIDAPCCLNEIALEATEDDFLTSPAKTLWKIIAALQREGKPVDLYTVKSRAPKEYAQFIEELSVVTPTAANWEMYLSELKRHSKLAKARQIAQDIADDAAVGAAEISDVRQKAEELLTILESEDARKTDFSMHEMAKGFLDSLNKPKDYLNFGMQTVNQYILCEPGDYVLIGAEPSAGKTALTLQFSVDIARSGKRVLYFSYETTQSKIAERIISCQGHVSYTAIKSGRLSDNQVSQCAAVARQLHKLPLLVVEAGGMTVEDIRAKAIKYRADVIFIDYIQQVSHRDARLTEYQRITEISRNIQQLCQKYKIITIALSQFSRLNGGRPTMHSFRSSGQLEQDINVGVLLYKPQDAEEEGDESRRIFDIAKNKDGRKGKIKLFFDGDYQTFTVEDSRR